MLKRLPVLALFFFVALLALFVVLLGIRPRGAARPEQPAAAPPVSNVQVPLPDEPWVRELSRFQPAAADDPIWGYIRASAQSHHPLVPGTVSKFNTDEGVVTVTVGYPIRIPNAYQKDEPMTVVPIHGFATGLYFVQDGAVHLRGTLQNGRLDQWGEDWVEIPLHPKVGDTFLQAYDECKVTQLAEKETAIGRLSQVAEVHCTGDGAENIGWYAPGVGLIANNAGMEIMEFRPGMMP